MMRAQDESRQRVALAACCQSGGHGIRTRNPLRGTTSPMWPLTIRLPSKTLGLSRFMSPLCTFLHLFRALPAARSIS